MRAEDVHNIQSFHIGAQKRLIEELLLEIEHLKARLAEYEKPAEKPSAPVA